LPEIREAGTEDHIGLGEFLSRSLNLYPHVDKWWEERVLPDLMCGRRLVFVLDEGGAIEGLIIAKRGKRAKICSLRVNESLRRKGWATRLLARVMAILIADGAEQVYVTVSEAAEPSVVRFFEELGFQNEAWVESKYVNGVDEFVYCSPSKRIAERLTRMFAGLQWVNAPDLFSPNGRGELQDQACAPVSLLMSIKPEFAERILRGDKEVEFRRRFSTKHIGQTVLFYVSKPIGSFMFTAKVRDVFKSRTAELWSSHHQKGAIDKDRFDGYFSGVSAGYALVLTDVFPLASPISLEEARRVSSELSPPQSFKRLRADANLIDFLNDKIHTGAVG
jgi:predicted transcriptional regulator/ribosomal protein S18 acetylase RimI-like enzyme